VSPNVAWSGSLESYHPYLQAKKVSKIPKIECIHSGLPKTAKSHFGRLGPLGINPSKNYCPYMRQLRIWVDFHNVKKYRNILAI
jgi:hypothetical protein